MMDVDVIHVTMQKDENHFALYLLTPLDVYMEMMYLDLKC